jgi:hypothetical protein
MKRGTPDHPKIKFLAERLRKDEVWATGMIELLFHATARYSPRGNIGKWNDRAIAEILKWRSKPDTLIDALVDTGWLDRDPDHRLIVHDWDEHADQSVRKVLAKQGVDFIRPSRSHCVYFIRAAKSGAMKIGVSSRRVEERMAEIQKHTMEKLELIGCVDGGYELEKELLEKFSALKIKGEWFRYNEELLVTVKELIANLAGTVPALESERVQHADGSVPDHRARVAFPEPQPVPVPVPAETQHAAQPQPRYEPLEGLDLSQLARDTIGQLAAEHPIPGNIRKAETVLERILGSAVEPLTVVEAAKRNHKAYLPYWEEVLSRPKPGFVPQLYSWFHEGDYMYPPKSRDAPVNGGGNSYLQRRLKEALEEEAKEREAKHGK